MRNKDKFTSFSFEFNNMSQFEKQSAKKIIKSYKILDNIMNYLDANEN